MYRHNTFDIRPAEVAPPQLSAHTEWSPEQPVDLGATEGGHASGGNVLEVVSHPATSQRLSATRSSPSPPRAVTRTGSIAVLQTDLTSRLYTRIFKKVDLLEC